MRTQNNPAYFDLKSQTKENYSLSLGIPERDVHIFTRQDGKGTWYAHLERALGPSPTKRIPVVHESGWSPDEALLKLHSTSGKATQAYYEHRGNQSSTGVRPMEVQDDGEDSEDDNDSVYSGSEDEVMVVDRNTTEARTRTVPFYERPSAEWPTHRLRSVVPATIPRDPRTLANLGAPGPKPPHQPSTRPTATPPRQGPSILNPNFTIQNRPPYPITTPQPPPSPSSSPPTVLVRIRIDFINHRTFEFDEVISLTQNDVLNAATRRCDRPMGTKCLRASLKAVARGGTRLGVDGCVRDLWALVGSLPERESLAVFEVEITKGPGV